MNQALKAHEAVDGEHRAPDRSGVVLAEKWIPRDHSCLPSARRLVRDTARDWNATTDCPEVAELLASELVTNALTHAGAQAPLTSTIRITIARRQELLVVEVHDSSTAPPRPRSPGPFDPRGRGLSIVQALAHAWGCTLRPYGKCVWFQLLAWP